MDLASQDAELKAALFRFVDVVPACRSLEDLARHLTGFLGEVEKRPPPIEVAMRMGNTKRRPRGARRGGRHRRQADGAPLHRRRGPEGRARRPARPLARRRRELGRPARRGDRHPGRGRALRGPLRDALDTLVAASAAWPARPQLERDSAGRAAAREPVGEGLRAHAAAAPRRARARQARRRRASAPAAAPREGARRAPAHRHGVAGLARRGARADPRAALRGRVPRRAVGRDGAAGLPARLAADARHDPRVARRRRRRARARADDPAREGRLLGPRARRGAPARLAGAGLRAQGRHRPSTSRRSRGGCSTRAPPGRRCASRSPRTTCARSATRSPTTA